MLKEFRDFIAKGNVLDLAVAVLIGIAFGAVVKSFTDDILMPAIGAFGRADFSGLAIHIGAATIRYGLFINSIINFLIVAFVLFLIVKAYNHMARPGGAGADMKKCPYCMSMIPVAATRCPECTSQLEQMPAA